MWRVRYLFLELYRNNKKIIEKHGEVFIPIDKFMDRLGLSKNDPFVLFKSLTGEHKEAIGLSFDARQTFEYEGVEISLFGRPHLGCWF
jgi:hypothetical protein